MSKTDKSKLTSEQKTVLFEEGTEPPGSSSLNYEKREGDYLCAPDVEQSSLSPKQNMKVVVVGHLFLKQLKMYFKQKLIT